MFHADNKPQFLRLIIRKTVYLQKTVMPMYIHEHKEWPSFSWNKELVGEKLNKVNKAVGYLMGRLSVIGFNDKMSAKINCQQDTFQHNTFLYHRNKPVNMV